MDLSEMLTHANMIVSSASSNYADALDSYYDQHPDVVLLDITLKGDKNGIELAKTIRKENPQLPLIYITGNSDSGTKMNAFDTNPSAFLTKPFIEQNLISAIELAFNRYSKLSTSKPTDYLLIKSGKKFIKLHIDDIQIIQAKGSYSSFITREETFLQSGNLNHFQSRLNGDFIRVHRSFLVNKEKITAINNGNVYVEDTGVPIGRKYKDNIKKIG